MLHDPDSADAGVQAAKEAPAPSWAVLCLRVMLPLMLLIVLAALAVIRSFTYPGPFFGVKLRDDRPPMTTGQVVIEGLEAYKREHGAYPAELDELIQAGYEVPSPDWGNDTWDYGLWDEDFYLSVGWNETDYPYCLYTSMNDDWFVDD